ncbi:Foldase protein PrsA [Phytophthora citrophthora]|uniref:Peptidyl-prolyl cis-trans isomerase n=1 Tax=Phytophthora citrophthora TaxID=4793 RepID=A0AAD9G8M5_9STRA|nr:Foldase protein PrsA [Phytophthora citrophthora]
MIYLNNRSMMKRVYTTLVALVLVVLAVTMLDVGVKVVEATDWPKARASHILVPTETECDEIAKELEAADDLEAAFSRLAKERSKCPSSRKGGDLGSFGRGQMVPAFDKVAFENPVGVVHKVKTEFGWHLVLITDRSGMGEGILDGLDDDEEEPQDRDL